MRYLVLAACAAAMLMACKAQQAPIGFESPSATIDSLFTAYGVREMSQDEARRRLQARERFELLKPELFRSCFADWQGEHDQALGGFVFGQLVAAKEELQISIEDDVATVRVAPPASGIQPVIVIKQDRAWKIDLRRSIPPKIRQSLYEVYRRARRAERRAQ